jgi:hypothetical protein
MEKPQNIGDFQREIVTQLAELSRLLGIMSSDDTTVQQAREAHLKLSVLIGKALDISMP